MISLDCRLGGRVLELLLVTCLTACGGSSASNVGSGTASTVVASGADGNSIVGVQYFRTNYFLLDFTSSLVGWK
jgi:hypothetical protein